MMGRLVSDQRQLFYEFDLENMVPTEHLLRGIDKFLDLSDLRRHLAPFYSHTGRPSVDPELMMRMLIVGYSFGIRSERRLCEEVRLNLAYRWFCRLGLEDEVPDHSTFSKNRHGRFRDSGLFRHVFEGVLRRCMKEVLCGWLPGCKDFLKCWRFGRVQSCVRPVDAMHMTAGLDGFRGSGPTLLCGL